MSPLLLTLAIFPTLFEAEPADAPAGRYGATRSLPSADATQAACTDGDFVYAISNTRVVQYHRETGRQIATSVGDAFHLNHAVVHKGLIYLAHSDYPKKPDQCDIRILDPRTMKLTVHHEFPNAPGSLTWMVPFKSGWWCCFAHYGESNHKTVLVQFDADWKETARWSFPARLVADWDKNSLSSGLADAEPRCLLATGHDKKLCYRLRVPEKPGEVEWLGTIPCPFTGQGIARDLKTDGLVGIDRSQKKIIFAIYEESKIGYESKRRWFVHQPNGEPTDGSLPKQ